MAAKGRGAGRSGMWRDAMSKYAEREVLVNTSIWTTRLRGTWTGKEQTKGGNGGAGNARKWKETERDAKGGKLKGRGVRQRGVCVGAESGGAELHGSEGKEKETEMDGGEGRDREWGGAETKRQGR